MEPLVRVEPLRGGRTDRPVSRTPYARDGLVLDVEPAGMDGARADDEDSIQRVGGRRRIRPEIILPVIGALFLVAALTKPWPNPPVGPRSPIAAASPSARPSGQVDDQTSGPQTDVQIGVPDGLTQAWSTVDWSVLGMTDAHGDWGFAAVTMTSLAGGSAGAGVTSPATNWTPVDSARQASTVAVAHGQSVFALALTWPSDLPVNGVTFVYLGGPEHPPYLPPPGFPPFTQVSPLPGDGVAPAGAGFDPDPELVPPAKSQGNSAPNILHSGTYWIPPSEASSQPTTGSIQSAWRTLPWAWPNGVYRVTIAAAGRTTTIRLNLLHSA
jgi:hypothetical protein